MLLVLLVLVTFLTGGVLASANVRAEKSTVDEVTLLVPASCSMAGTVSNENTYTRNVSGGSYVDNIGTTEMKVLCNDYEGFAVYAVGFTNNTEGNNTMLGAGTNLTIATGTATSGNVSNWAMKVTKVTNAGGGAPDTTYEPDNLSIENDFGSYHSVPNVYTKVARFQAASGSSATDLTLGSHIKTNYAVFITSAQAAGTYTGKVKYMLVHPAVLAEGTYTIVYNAGGGTGTMNNETGVRNYESHVLATNTYTAPDRHEFIGWCTIQNANQAIQTTCEGDSYADGGTLPIYPNSTAANGTLNLYAYWEPQIAYMQDVADWGDDLAIGDEIEVADARDGKTYTVAKLADGNIWMTQNLDHDIGDIEGGTYTSSDTDIPSDWTPSDSAYTKESSDTTWATGSTGRSTPQSYDPGDVCWNG